MQVLNTPDAVYCTDFNCNNKSHKVQLSKCSNSILNALYTSGKECIPISGTRKQKYKPGCDVYCEESRQRSIFWHRFGVKMVDQEMG